MQADLLMGGDDQVMQSGEGTAFQAIAGDALDGRFDNVEAEDGGRRGSDSRGNIRVLVELRPALDGFSGIPQETRLLFRTLLDVKGVVVTGLLQHGGRDIPIKLAPPATKQIAEGSDVGQINTMSRVVAAFSDDGYRGTVGTILRFGNKAIRRIRLRLALLFGVPIRLGAFSPNSFEDFVWRTFFAKTLPIEDRIAVIGAQYRVLTIAMATLNRIKLSLFGLMAVKRFMKVDTRDFDIFVVQTPFPGVVSRRTRLIVRYHDAIPIFMPHTIKDRAFHQAAHFDALCRNVRQGAYFACVSAATRDDLLKIFPEIGERAVVIHNTVSPIFREEESSRELVAAIVSSRLFRPLGKKYKELTASQLDMFARCRMDPGQQDFRYLLVVSTIEPRKNHASVLAAWELLRSRHRFPFKLVFVGDLGWEYSELVDALTPWVERGQFFQLSNVPAADLRVLYKHAEVTVCPSYAEGFDYAGVESMLSGGLVAASDIAVHREVYQDACIYFDPYSVESMVRGILDAMALRETPTALAEFGVRAQRVAAQYRRETMGRQWKEFIQIVGRAHGDASR